MKFHLAHRVDAPRADDASADPMNLNETAERDPRNDAPRAARSWKEVAVLSVLPMLVMSAASGVGYLRWEQSTLSAADDAQISSAQAATDATVAMLSYQPDTVEEQLTAAESKLTGDFRESYTTLIKDVVIPGARQKRVSADAAVPATASVTATANHAVVLVFVNQVLVMADDAPTSTTSSVRVTLDKVDGDWLVSGFDPV